MVDEREINKLAGEMQMQQSRGETIRQQVQQMEATVLEIGAAIDAITNLKKAKSDTLVPIGAGAFISCPKPDSGKVVVNIGASVMVEKTPDEAVKILEGRRDNVGKALQTAQEDLADVVRAMDAISQKASLLAAGENQNVRPSKE